MTEQAKTPEKDEKPAAKAPAAPVKKTVKVFPVYGPMHDPHTGITYGETGVEVLTPDPWVQSQIDAKKMRVE